ncbi:hypothetical protein [Rhizobium sp. LjRoot258]|jgi:hypothetical protein
MTPVQAGERCRHGGIADELHRVEELTSSVLIIDHEVGDMETPIHQRSEA